MIFKLNYLDGLGTLSLFVCGCGRKWKTQELYSTIKNTNNTYSRKPLFLN